MSIAHGLASKVFFLFSYKYEKEMSVNDCCCVFFSELFLFSEKKKEVFVFVNLFATYFLVQRYYGNLATVKT